jgi:dGTPase
MTLNNREQIEQREKVTLAGYAVQAAGSRGRVYPEMEHPLRTCFQRDRDRIVHAAAFRRMEYKTQVFLPHEGDHFRTRLTHTVEVAQIARTLARCLGLNEDLAESIALAHDLGHTPFGHAGEDVLDELLHHIGGFNHNRQSLRVIELLEQRYPGFPGLNLSYEVREGIAKHETKTAVATEEFHPEEQTTLEAALVDLADEIAYNAADVDDGISSGLLHFHDLMKLELVRVGDLPAGLPKLPDDMRRYALARALVNQMATDLMQESERRIEAHGIRTLDDVRAATVKLVGFSEYMEGLVLQLKDHLFTNLYRHVQLIEIGERAGRIIRTLFERFIQAPKLMPSRFYDMVKYERIEIVVTDYIAGMTDRYAEKRAGE